MYRKNVAGQYITFQGIDATTGGIKSGVTWTVRRCIDGTFAAATGTVTEDGTTGWYKFAMSQADTNGNNIQFNFTGTGAVPQTVNILTTACDPTAATNFGITALPATAVSTNASLLTSGTGTDQLSVSAGKVLLQATQTGVTIPTVTTVTNQLTAAQIATGVWQDTTAGDFTVASSIGKSLYTSGNAPGAASGLALVGSNMGTVSSVTGNVSGSVGSVATGGITRASFAADTGLQSSRSNTAQAGASGSITLDASASATNDFYKYQQVRITGGTGAGQSRFITAYNGTTKVATVLPAWATAPDATSTYAICDLAAVDVETWLATAVTAATAGIPDVNTKNLGNTAQTGRDIGASVLISVGTGAGQINVASGKVPATLAAADVTGNVAADLQTIKTQTVTCAGGVTVPAATLASTTNITAGTITTVGTTTNLTNLPSIPNNWITAAGIASGALTAAVWDGSTTGHTTGGTFGGALNAAGSAGDPWATSLPGAYSAGSAGYILGNRLDAAVSSRMATFSLPTNFSSLAINGSGHVILQDASLVTAKLGTFALAKTTNITGFNDIAATAIVSGGAITTSGGAVSTVTNLTNDPPGVTTLLSRVTSTLFSGITSLAQWLGLLAGKQTGNTTARTELRATGAGAGTYDETTDSLEANRDNLGTQGGNLLLAKTTNITGFNDIAATAIVSGGAITTSGGVAQSQLANNVLHGGDNAQLRLESSDSNTAALRIANTYSGIFGSVGALEVFSNKSSASSFTCTNGSAISLSASGAGTACINTVQSTGAVAFDTDIITQIQNGLATSTTLAAVKTKTDQLTFTSAGLVDANTEKINNTTVLGTGTSGDKWRG